MIELQILYTDNLIRIITIFLLIFLSLVTRYLMLMIGQKWVSSTSHTVTLVLLPILTYVITSVISGNIALSLGMVGALSIVRFRNPVRSPLELSVYFAAITMGISASVSLKWLIFLVISLIFAVVIIILINKYSTLILKKPFLNTSFSEGNSLSTLEISSSMKITFIEQSNLLSSVRIDDTKYYYVLASQDFNELKKIQDELSLNMNVSTLQLVK